MADYDNYLQHYRRSGNCLPDWAGAEADPNRFKLVDQWLPEDLDAAILDIGCGWGRTLLQLWASGYRQVEGVEHSAEMAAAARIAAQGRVRIHHADALTHLSSAGPHYDRILLFSVIEHIPKPQVVPLLRAAYNALKPGGAVILYTPNLANITSAWIYYSDFTHTTGFTELSMQYVLEQAGFQRYALLPVPRPSAALWRPWRPWRGTNLAHWLDHRLHRCAYVLSGQRPLPTCTSATLRVAAFKSV